MKAKIVILTVLFIIQGVLFELSAQTAQVNSVIPVPKEVVFADQVITLDRADVGVGVAVELTRNLSASNHAALKVIVFRLRSVLPPSVYAGWEQTLAKILPVGCCSIGIKEINPVSAVNIITGGVHLSAHLTVLVNLGPY